MAKTKKPAPKAAKKKPAAAKAAPKAKTAAKAAPAEKPAKKATAAAAPRKKAAPARAASAVPARAASATPAAAVPPPAARAPAKREPISLAALVQKGREVLGIKDLRPGQGEALEHILADRDVLAIMPTGSGKSLLYQLPSLVWPGITVVVSPLIALIKDQVDKMRDKGVAVCKIDSTLTAKQRKEMMALAAAPGGKLLVTTPERMANPEFWKELLAVAGPAGIARFVLDEAHCVSQWGHDFRPSYLVLKQAIHALGRPPVLATTATAPPHVAADILYQLDCPDAEVVLTGFERPNLHYEVIAVPGEDEKKKILVSLLKKLRRPGIVYAATVRVVEQLTEELSRLGLPVRMYHGRLTKKERDSAQNDFMASSDMIMVATNAFGLGVDKPNIRYVMHYHVPGSLEAYAQEAGRGGRDGKPTRCVLLFSPDDVAIQEFFLKGTYPSRRQVMSVLDALHAFQGEDRIPGLMELAASAQIGAARARTVLELMKEEGWAIEEKGTVRLADPPPEREKVFARALEYEKKRIADRRRLDALLEYVREGGCRDVALLAYLGEKGAPACGRCDNCMRSAEEASRAARAAAELEDAITRAVAEDDAGAGAIDEEIEPPRRQIKVRTISIDPVVPPAATANGVTAAGTAAAAAPVAPAAADDDLVEDEDDDDDLDDDDLDDEDDLDEDQDDDEDEDDDDLEIDMTAAELAAMEDDPEGGEITVLKRKRREKPPKVKAQPGASADESRSKKRRRRRRKKKRSMLPPRSAFTSPVLVVDPRATANGTHAPPPAAPPPVPAELAGASPADAPPAPLPAPRAPAPPAKAGGPVIEYVRRPLKLGASPVASATPNDRGPGGGKRRRDFRPGGHPGGGPGQHGGGGHGRRAEGIRRPYVPGQPAPPPAQGTGPTPTGSGPGAPSTPWQPGQPGQPSPPGMGKRRRRKRRRGGGMGFQPGANGMSGQPGQPPFQNGAPPPGGPPSSGSGGPGTVANGSAGPAPGGGQPWQPGQPGQPSPPGMGKRRRRRRRRRGNGPFPMNGAPLNGAPPSAGGGDGGGSGPSPSGPSSGPSSPGPSSPGPSSGGGGGGDGSSGS